MPHDHSSHSHSHHHHTTSGKNIKAAFFLNLGFTILEIIGGFYVNSVSILSDALHDLGDSFSLGISWYLHNRSKKEADNKFTFGYSRFSILGALINSVILMGGSVYVIIEAIKRLIHPEPSDAQGMLIFAIIGILVNGYAAFKLSHGSSLNERVVSWHLIEDVLGWVAVLIVSIVMMFTDAPYLDPALSLAITLFILYNVIKRLRETFVILLQGTPEGIDPEKIKMDILAVDNIASLHHMNIWSLEGEHHVFTAHIKLKYIINFSQMIEAKQKVKQILKKYPFSHYTIEVELTDENCELAPKQDV
ncbi:cation diffusion facilitator family transporter [Flavobacterium sp. DG1-102-2]|uniref:cation diffusion facilitator family transporter n=1 Tax=Flavobacterium sp. DG1-102-2 TaxID=3081663 RepID=UPI0029495247|nr:cation diffusion facilitator family transporter [Flavobacterium sp. DG1-102-2]MDV6169117.1 cation diffusion facilitator family transporter [Flavobacterium sp. DG1-102-2]